MPLAQISLLRGASDEQKRAVIANVTDALCRSLDAPSGSVRVLIQELGDIDWGVGGVPVRDHLAK